VENNMSKVILFYNHKGGVSKTTTTFNLARLLAEEGNKTLVVDADPQCNITELMLGTLINSLDEETVKTGKETELPGTSLLDILKPRIDGDVPVVDILKVKVVSVTKNLDLIRGDVSLNSIEDSLAEAHVQRFSNKTHELRTYVSIGDFFTRLGEIDQYKYILVDVGPSAGALTRSCFLACDGFFIPVSPDRFNVQAISTLSSILDRWIGEHAQIYDQFIKLGLPIKHGKPIFLGTIAQHFKIFKGHPKPGFKLWMDRIPEKINTKLLPVLKKYSGDRDMTAGMKSTSSPMIEIPDFGSLASVMQEYGKAVFQIEQKDTKILADNNQPWAGATWTGALERMKDFRSRFETIKDRLSWLK
jgi:chromosome partitioning protein